MREPVLDRAPPADRAPTPLRCRRARTGRDGAGGQLSATPDGGGTTFLWRPDPADDVLVEVTVSRLPNARTVLEEVVRSTRPAPVERLVAIANAARVDPHPDMSWPGER